MYSSYSMTPAPGPISLWVKGTQFSQLNCAHNLETVCSPPFTPFANASSNSGNPTNPSLTEQCNNWGTPSLKERYYNFGTSPKNSKRLDRKSLMPTPRSDMPSKLRCWPPAPSPPPDRPWTLPSSVSNRPELIAPSTHFYFAKPFGMSATTKQWSIFGITFTASCKWEDDHHRQIHRVWVLHLLISPTSWHGLTIHPVRLLGALGLRCEFAHLTDCETTG